MALHWFLRKKRDWPALVVRRKNYVSMPSLAQQKPRGSVVELREGNERNESGDTVADR